MLPTREVYNIKKNLRSFYFLFLFFIFIVNISSHGWTIMGFFLLFFFTCSLKIFYPCVPSVLLDFKQRKSSTPSGSIRRLFQFKNVIIEKYEN